MIFEQTASELVAIGTIRIAAFRAKNAGLGTERRRRKREIPSPVGGLHKIYTAVAKKMFVSGPNAQGLAP